MDVMLSQNARSKNIHGEKLEIKAHIKVFYQYCVLFYVFCLKRDEIKYLEIITIEICLSRHLI